MNVLAELDKYLLPGEEIEAALLGKSRTLKPRGNQVLLRGSDAIREMSIMPDLLIAGGTKPLCVWTDVRTIFIVSCGGQRFFDSVPRNPVERAAKFYCADEDVAAGATAVKAQAPASAALERSEDHWHELMLCKTYEEVRKVGIGKQSCSLCDVYYFERCNGCPVKEKAGESECRQTPHEAAAAYLAAVEIGVMEFSQLHWYALARREYEFLRSLRTDPRKTPPVYKGAAKKTELQQALDDWHQLRREYKFLTKVGSLTDDL